MRMRKGAEDGKAVIYTSEGTQIVDIQARRLNSIQGDSNQIFLDGLRNRNDYLLVGAGSVNRPEMIDDALRYTKTKFFRLIIDLQRLAQFEPIHAHNQVMEYNHWFDNAHDSDIDFSASVPEIDAQFYRKYGFTDAMIKFVEERYAYDDLCS